MTGGVEAVNAGIGFREPAHDKPDHSDRSGAAAAHSECTGNKPDYSDEAGAKATMYQVLISRLESLISEEPDWLANLSNASALLFQFMPDISWAGFYLLKESVLVLGPFQGKPACVRILLGKGVCGTAAMTGRTILVPDVHLFPGHIACDEASVSEIVVPIIQKGHMAGVLDIDSPVRDRFDETDAVGLEAFVLALLKHVRFPS
jgi:L-methionine (R)-S-oxide reductase